MHQAGIAAEGSIKWLQRTAKGGYILARFSPQTTRGQRTANARIFQRNRQGAKQGKKWSPELILFLLKQSRPYSSKSKALLQFLSLLHTGGTYSSKALQTLRYYIQNIHGKPSHSLTWGIMEIFFRKSWSPSSDVKYLSIQILPSGSAKRKRAAIRELFPAPVLPTIPTYGASQARAIKLWAFQEKLICLATLLQHHRIYSRTCNQIKLLCN